ncbi:unnamed protein product [Triticum turgidum subsp. durum]|uniref:Trichome birefringence-like N-terminal domain-containing protein n=1 Tax=Triticum turgidum subsp. durum TaxID=4567 RepID=A0A9R0Z7S6_TRITD|nr:unnamed protein product [Triticum turgidum subsp. durum]
MLWFSSKAPASYLAEHSDWIGLQQRPINTRTRTSVLLVKSLPMIPSLGTLLAGVRRSRHAIAKTTPVSALAALLFLAAATFWLLFLGPLGSPNTTSSSGADTHGMGATACDTTLGEWVRDPTGARPHYTNATCAFIQDYQNCMKHGRPSLDFLQWRWRPDGGPGCELPRFDAARFFRIVRGKSILFVGDSLASSHVTSLMCTLSEAEIPTRRSADGFEHWRFPAHDFAVSFFWTPFQVRWRLTSGPPEAVGPDRHGEVFAGPSDLHLDEPDERWMPAAKEHDYVVVSASHWFARPAVYYRRGRAVGCHGCGTTNGNITALPPRYAQRAAFRTVLRALAELDGFKGTAILRTVAPTHYANGGWFDGGECPDTQPLDRDEAADMEEPEGGFYRAQLEEFGAAEEEARKNGVRLRLMDVTRIMLRRPDGHPDRYGHGAGDHGGFDIDCLHWCLPGPIDVWNELLLHIMAG